ncbi:hypothetical protein DPMN_170448 [Dreissena polymorpha]|uniref:Uncharacterized protein n=1 Tax=Dreissena polymorpha TaxID=45954 RepID=A0A9D4DZA1_DREPO|nr:hypothetical protein DPMN_170448 [Dreissena polymorpha]
MDVESNPGPTQNELSMLSWNIQFTLHRILFVTGFASFAQVFAIGIGGSNHELNKTELEVIASDKRNVHIVQDFDALNSIYDKLKNNVCTGHLVKGQGDSKQLNGFRMITQECLRLGS